MWINTFIGLGSNLSHPIQQVKSALIALKTLPDCRLIRHSNLYHTPPLGPPNQPYYINAVAALETQLAPMDLLIQLHNIEINQGRTRSIVRWEARTLDLDLLLYGELQLNQPKLTIPHPYLHQRAFVLIPLLEITHETLWIPGIGYLNDILKKCDQTGIERLKEYH